MKESEFKQWDIVIVDKTPVQVVGRNFDNGIFIEDIHTKKTLTHKNLMSKASKSEVKWFCENTEHIKFVPPKQEVR